MVLGQIWVSDYFYFCFDQKIGGKQIFNGRHLEPRTSAKVVSEKQKKTLMLMFSFWLANNYTGRFFDLDYSQSFLWTAQDSS